MHNRATWLQLLPANTDTDTDHRLALVDLRGAVSLRGWWVAPFIARVAAGAAMPAWTGHTLRGLFAAVAAAFLVGAFWTDMATHADTPPLRLVWPPLLAVALMMQTTPQAALTALVWCGVALAQSQRLFAQRMWPRLLGAVAFPWWLGWFAVHGDWQWQVVLVPLAGMLMAWDCWKPAPLASAAGALLLALLLAWQGETMRLAGVAVLFVGMWFFRLHRSVMGGDWYRQHVQGWLVVLLGLAAW